MCECSKQWQPASAADINRFHTDMYVAFLQQLTCNAASVVDEVYNHVLNASVCFTETAWIYSTLYAGASIAAAQALISGDDVALSFMGGQTHARRDCASGVSYVNDVVLAILHLLRAPVGALEDPASTGGDRRVLFLNLDAWHASGVEEAFYTTDRVLTISVHRCAAADGNPPRTALATIVLSSSFSLLAFFTLLRVAAGTRRGSSPALAVRRTSVRVQGPITILISLWRMGWMTKG